MSATIKTPVLKYWKFSEDPFSDHVLRGKTLALFANRDDERNNLYNSLTSRITGVYGEQGIGKSSCLRKLEQTLKKDGNAVAYIQLTGKHEAAVYREILSEILKTVSSKQLRLNKKAKIDAKLESQRVQHGINITTQAELGAEFILTTKLQEKQKKIIHPHTEETAKKLIKKIISNITTKHLIVIIDDLERAKHLVKKDVTYFRFVTAFVRTIDEAFSCQEASFVVSLDDSFVDSITRGTSGEKASVSFSFGELIRLPCFNPKDVAKILRNRVLKRTTRKSLSSLLKPDAFWVAMLASRGHPRVLLKLLRLAMRNVEKRKKERVLGVDCIKVACQEERITVDNKDIEIISYLREKVKCTASDQILCEKLNVTRQALSARLKKLENVLSLKVVEQQTKTSPKTVYYILPKVNLD